MTNVLDQWVKGYGLILLMHDFTAENKPAPPFCRMIVPFPLFRFMDVHDCVLMTCRDFIVTKQVDFQASLLFLNGTAVIGH